MNRVFWRAVGVFAGVALCASLARASKVSDLEAAVAALNNRLDQVEQREENLKIDIEAQNQDLVMDLKKSQADIRTDINALRQELSQLEEIVKELSQRLSSMEAKMTTLPQDGNTPVTTIASADQAPAAAEAGSAKQRSANDAYDLGVKFYKDGQFDAARPQFEAFLKANPNAAGAEDAQFKIAECYFQQRDFKRAIIEYDQFRQKYPKSKKMPAALFKMGLSFEKLGKKDVAATTYKDLITLYPKSQEAAQAKLQLDKIGN